MSIHQSNIAMLRALSEALTAENHAAAETGKENAGRPGADAIWLNVAVLAHLARAALRAAESLQRQQDALANSDGA